MTNDASRDERDVKGQKKRKVEANDGEIKAEKQKPSTAGSHVVHWGVDVMMVAIETGDPEVVQNGDDEIAKISLPKGRCVLDYESCESVKLIEMLLGCGYIQRDEDLASAASKSLASFGVWISCSRLFYFTLPLAKFDR
ncbi:hypothetical protein F442_05160 [Phytophthora nicotianae P10297]|uniref:Uncharacterized protein n=1 Tax=Phytophthora nicotianae P10297 TaxID=1317064 RepID=W2ZPI6_PHYNI|nr:hypothetical protein F442_05160 [Phytophthora nicotianae P10297]